MLEAFKVNALFGWRCYNFDTQRKKINMDAIETLQKIIDNSHESKKLFKKYDMDPEFLSQEDINIRFLNQKSKDLLFNYTDSIKKFKIFSDYENSNGNSNGLMTLTRARLLKIDKDSFEKSLSGNDQPNNFLSEKQIEAVESWKNYWISNKFDNYQNLNEEYNNIVQQRTKKTFQI